jgi:predicted alpha/beta superfamily hydrolase
MGEARAVNVVLPAGYAKEPQKRYPVLYLIDGGLEQDLLHVAGAAHLGAVWGRSAEAIVVGIETKDRRKELAGPTKDPELLKRYPTAGRSASFRGFIRDEVKPLIAKNYRTNGRDTVLGESLAGLFIVETYLAEPTLFDAYAAIDPSLWWDREALSRMAVANTTGAQKGKSLYLAIAKEQAGTPIPMQRVAQAAQKAGSPLCLAWRPDLLHSTIYQQLTPQALQFLLPPTEKPAPEFGFSVQCSVRP